MASEESARTIAHRFADKIVLRCGAVNGIAETKIYFMHTVPGTKEVWVTTMTDKISGP